MTANAFMSVSLRPPLVVISVDRRAKMHALLHEGRRYGISVLADEQRSPLRPVRGHAPAEGTEEVEFDVVHDTPLVRGALAHLVARVVRSNWGGDHSLFVGQVEYARYGEGQPLLFQGGRYQHLLERAPVFSSLPPEILAAITAEGDERTFESGEFVVREGEPGRRALRDHRRRGPGGAEGERALDVRGGGVLRRDRGDRRPTTERRRRRGVAVASPRDLARPRAERASSASLELRGRCWRCSPDGSATTDPGSSARGRREPARGPATTGSAFPSTHQNVDVRCLPDQSIDEGSAQALPAIGSASTLRRGSA